MNPRAGTAPPRVALAIPLLLPLLGLSVGWVSIPDVRTGGVPAPPSTEALLIGSSSVGGEVGLYLGSELRRVGIHLSRQHRSSSGFARPDFYDWGQHLDELGDLASLRALFIYMGGNDAQMLRLRREEEATEPNHRGYVMWTDQEQWSRLYRGRVVALINALCDAGVPRVVIIVPGNGGRQPRWTERIVRVQEDQLAAAGQSRCGVGIDTRLRNNGIYPARDGVHLNRTGAQMLMQRIRPSLLRALEIQGETESEENSVESEGGEDSSDEVAQAEP